MTREKKGKVLPKKGKVLHLSGQNTEIPYLEDIALTLRTEFGANRNAIKEVMRWTGASERAVKYWLAGTSGPSGEHLIALVAASDSILAMLLRRAGREDLQGALRLYQSRDRLSDLVEILRTGFD
jgi:hypothetical protein